MNKPKIVLTALTLITIVSSIFAFNVAKRGALTYFTTSSFCSIAPSVNAIFQGYVTTNISVNNKYWTTVAGQRACNYNRVASGL
jgi:hypothetical protein